MRKTTVKLLRTYAQSGHHYATLKQWWKGLTRPERQQAAEEVRTALGKRRISSEE